VGRLRREGRVDHHSPLVSDVAIGRGSAWLSMPTFTGSSWDDKPGILRRVDLATGKVVAGVSCWPLRWRPGMCCSRAPPSAPPQAWGKETRSALRPGSSQVRNPHRQTHLMLWSVRYRLLCWLFRLVVRCSLDELDLENVVLRGWRSAREPSRRNRSSDPLRCRREPVEVLADGRSRRCRATRAPHLLVRRGGSRRRRASSPPFPGAEPRSRSPPPRA